MPDYQNAKIYKLVNDTLGLTYYGSTVQSLSVRKACHKSSSNKVYGKCSSRLLFDGKSDVDIVLVEKYPCNDREELHKRERFYIENNDCVNITVPLRTKKEWLDAHPNYDKDYRKKNRVRLRELKKKATEKRKDHYLDYQKKWKDANADKIREHARQKFVCECGSVVSIGHKARHIKTDKHKRIIKNLGEEIID